MKKYSIKVMHPGSTTLEYKIKTSESYCSDHECFYFHDEMDDKNYIFPKQLTIIEIEKI